MRDLSAGAKFKTYTSNSNLMITLVQFALFAQYLVSPHQERTLHQTKFLWHFEREQLTQAQRALCIECLKRYETQDGCSIAAHLFQNLFFTRGHD